MLAILVDLDGPDQSGTGNDTTIVISPGLSTEEGLGLNTLSKLLAVNLSEGLLPHDTPGLGGVGEAVGATN